MNIRIVTDSTCDLPAHIVEKHGITVIPLYINQGDQSYLDGVDLSREEFYRLLPGFHPAPSTATPSTEVFMQAWNKLVDTGADAILSIHISEKLSATINVARVAADQFTRIPVTVLDSSQLSLGMGFIVEKAAQMAELGHKMEANIMLIVVNLSGSRSLFTTVNSKNKALWLIVVGAMLSLLMILLVPPLKNLFHFSSVALTDFLIAALVGVSCFSWFKFFDIRKRKKLLD